MTLRLHKNDYCFLVIGCPIRSSFNSSLVTFDSQKALEARLTQKRNYTSKETTLPKKLQAQRSPAQKNSYLRGRKSSFRVITTQLNDLFISSHNFSSHRFNLNDLFIDQNLFFSSIYQDQAPTHHHEARFHVLPSCIHKCFGSC